MRTRNFICAGAAFDGGFGLLEIVLVLAIMTIVTAIVAPRYQRSLIRYRTDLAARRIVADLIQAQSSAKAASTSRTVAFSVAGSTYQISELSPLDGNSGNYSVALSEQPYDVGLVSADFGDDAQIIYNGWGIPDNGGTVVLTVGSESRAITVEAETGKVTFE